MRVMERAPAETVTLTQGRRLLLFVTILLLPFSLIPLELVHHKISLNYPLFVIILVLGISFGVMHMRFDRLERIVLLFGLYMVMRTLFSLAGINSSPSAVTTEIGREATKVFSAIVVYRVAQVSGALPTIRRAVTAMMVVVVALGFYQYHEGIHKLQGLGYVTPDFNYYSFVQTGPATFGFGSFRPFGTFPGPTVYAAYIAMLLGFLIWTNQGVGRAFWRWAVLLFGIAGLLLTDTRAAWISLALSLGIVALIQAPTARVRAARVGIAALMVAFIFLLIEPAAAGHIVTRFGTLFNSGYTSNTDRVTLWGGTWHALTSGYGVFLFGYGVDNFALVLGRFISPDVASLGHAHNVYLELMFEYGAIGLLLYLAVLGRMIGGLRRVVLAVKRTPQMKYASAAIGAITAFAINGLFENLWTGYNFFVTVFLLVGVGFAVKRPAL